MWICTNWPHVKFGEWDPEYEDDEWEEGADNSMVYININVYINLTSNSNHLYVYFIFIGTILFTIEKVHRN